MVESSHHHFEIYSGQAVQTATELQNNLVFQQGALFSSRMNISGLFMICINSKSTSPKERNTPSSCTPHSKMSATSLQIDIRRDFCRRNSIVLERSSRFMALDESNSTYFLHPLFDPGCSSLLQTLRLEHNRCFSSDAMHSH